MSPQSSRQVEVKDIYFDEYGFYLGVDEQPTNNIRIMRRDDWYALGGKNGKIVNGKNKIATNNSVPFSDASLGEGGWGIPLKPSAILSVYEWIANNLLNLFVDLGLNNSLGEGILMQSHSIPDIYGINIEEQTIDINQSLMAQKELCDNVFNIASVLVHERQHLRDAISLGLYGYVAWGKDFQEWQAYTTQVILGIDDSCFSSLYSEYL